jgi:ADP-ribose pyrophosphatase YjhB (NUDIX family)
MTSPQHPNAQKQNRRRGGRSGRPPRVHVEISAGGIVYKRTRKGLKLALMLDPFGKWTFAKGHVEAGETIEAAAVRETTEEMALRDLKLRQPLGIIDFWFREKYRPGTKGMLVHKFVHYYLMEVPPGEWGSPQKTEKIRQIAWIDPREALEKSSYEDVRPVLEKALIALGVQKKLPPPAAGAPPEEKHRRPWHHRRRRQGGPRRPQPPGGTMAA